MQNKKPDIKESVNDKSGTRIVVPGSSWQAGKHLSCPECGNDRYFTEVAHDVTIITNYVQNSDGSFTPKSDDSTINGEVRLYCAVCHADLSAYYHRFAEMIF